jgi:hypothetical protein
MDPNTYLLNVAVFSLAALLVIALGSYVAMVELKSRAVKRKVRIVRAAIIDYFRKIDIEVEVDGAPVPGTDRLTIFIESEPMKQMRLSHIIEVSLRDMVHNLHQVELDKIYWRFPIKSRPRDGAPAKGEKPEGDDYINEGLSQRHLPKAEVEEASWDVFQQASTRGPDPER